MLRYIGHGFLPGVPARDLTDAEVEQFGRESLIASGLYIPVEDKALRPQRETKQGRVVSVESASLSVRDKPPTADNEE